MKINYISIIGSEGAGKSTAIETIVAFAKNKNITTNVVREPGGTPVAEKLRDIIKSNDYDEHIDTFTELLLFYASRNQSLNNQVKVSIDKDELAIGDRCYLCTRAYQGSTSEYNDLLDHLENHIIKPDLVLYLDLDPVIGLQRVDARGERDRIEKKDLEYFQGVRREYQKLASTHKNIITIDASQSIEDVSKNITDILTLNF